MKKQLLQILALIFIELIVLYPVSFAHAFSISNVTVSDISSGSAKISWFTDDVADGKVRYGKTTGLGFTSRHSTYVFDHSRILQSLESETKYYFKRKTGRNVFWLRSIFFQLFGRVYFCCIS